MNWWNHGVVRATAMLGMVVAALTLLLLGSTPASAELREDAAVLAVVRGFVATADGALDANHNPPPAPASTIDLHRQNEDGSTGDLIRSLTTRTGHYSFAVTPDCYTVVVNAPDGYSFFGQPTQENALCVTAGEERWVYTQIVDAMVQGTIEPQSTQYPTKVDIFEARADGSRGRFLTTTTSTGNENFFSFNLRPGCYVLTFIAPDGTSFAGRRWFQPGFCVEAGDIAQVDAQLLLSDPFGVQAGILGRAEAAANDVAPDPSDDNPAFQVMAQDNNEVPIEADNNEAPVEAAVTVELRGYVRNADNSAVVGAKVVVFEQTDHRLRGRFLGSLTTNEFGEFSGQGPLSCYVYIFIAPDGRTFSGSRFDEFPFCNGSGGFVVATLDAETPAIIGGRISRRTRDEDQVVPEIGLDLYAAISPDERGARVDNTVTVNNRYSFGVEPGCYIVDPLLPDGFRIDDDFVRHDFYSCVEDGEINLHVDAHITTDPGQGTITGVVTSIDGPESDISVDLYRENDDGERGPLVTSARTASHEGRYTVVAPPGCYVLVIPAPGGREFVDGSAEFTFSTCLVHGQYVTDVDAELAQDAMPPGSFGGVVTTAEGDPVEGLKITLWYVTESGRRGQFVQPDFTNDEGRYWFPGVEGCYWMVYIAPEGESFNGGRFLERMHCVPVDETPFHEIDVSLD